MCESYGSYTVWVIAFAVMVYLNTFKEQIIPFEPVYEISNNVVCATSIRAVRSEPLPVVWVFYDC